MTVRAAHLISAALGLLAFVALSCHDDPEGPDCSAQVDLSCKPAYEPTFANIFQNTFSRSCALAGPSCHAAAGAKAGLVLETSDRAYDLLHQHDRVVPGKPECSLVVRKITSKEVSFQMPPGLPLAPDEQCAIIQWIERGAAK